MASWVSILQSKTYLTFLNISFLLLICFFIKTQFNSSESLVLDHFQPFNGDTQEGCEGLQRLNDYKAKCLYLKSQNPCESNGYIPYLYLFYCMCGNFPVLGYFLVFLWLLVLFYLLGNTASVYFCSSLESLSRLLNLSPTIAGVTLLSLGNGAPDVFGSLVSFVGSGTSGVGLNSVLGGVFFVSCVVVGIISIVMSPHKISVDKSDFIRDVCFFFLGILAVLLILIIGKVNFWGAIGFSSLYFIYVLAVYIMHVYWKSNIEGNAIGLNSNYGNELGIPILLDREKEEAITMQREALEPNGHGEVGTSCFNLNSSALFCRVLYFLELPLYLPRRLTIPVACEERWSKPFAVASVTLAPVLLAALFNSEDSNLGSEARLVIYVFGGLIGAIFGILAFVTTDRSTPPKKFLFPWLAGGFVMSVTWTYIAAQELVALLVSLGTILGINPSILGLTVLAWGNSLGDLITNVAMASNGAPDGTQIAFSGCYAGPIFNTLVGLGLSLLVSSWYVYPSSLVISRDPFLFETLAFLVCGLLWALVILPLRNMKLDRFLGAGLIAIYMCSISLRLLQTLQSLQLHNDDT